MSRLSLARSVRGSICRRSAVCMLLLMACSGDDGADDPARDAASGADAAVPGGMDAGVSPRSGAGGATAGRGGAGGVGGRAGATARDAAPSAGSDAGATAGADAGPGPLLPPCEGEPSHAPNARLMMLGANQAVDLGEFGCSMPDADDYDCAQVTDYSGSVYDCKSHRLLMFGGGHATTFTDALFAFDFETLRWNELWAPTPCSAAVMSAANFDRDDGAWREGPSGPYPRPISRHTYDLTVYIDVLDEYAVLVGPNGDSGSCPPGSTGYTFASLSAHVAHFAFGGGAWSFSASATGDGHPEYTQGEYAAAELDPPSGQVVMLGGYGLYVYDPVSREKRVVLDNYNADAFGDEQLGYANELVYFPPNQRHYYFGGGSDVWEVELDRADFARSTLERLTTSGDAPPGEETGFAYDSQNQIIGGGVHEGTFYVFDPESAEWQALAIEGDAPGSQAFHAIDYDPVDGVFVFVTDDRRTFAYRYK